MHYTVAFLFWAALLIPGFALTMRWAPGLTKGGLMSTIAVSFLATLAILMPVGIIGFLTRTPLIIISGFLVLSVIWGTFDIFRSGAWREWKNQASSLLRLEALVVAFGFSIQARIGSFMGADALIHLARVRQIIDHGLTNADPFIKGDFFYPIYHTNIYHVLLASCAQLTQVHYLDVWYGALPVMFLLIGSAIYFMTYQIFANRWAAWTATLFFLADQGHVNFLVYPNKVSPFFLLPLLVGLSVRALSKKPTYKDAVPIGAASLALGMFHGMYAFFGAILVGPAFLVLGIRSLIRKEGIYKKYALCMFALILSLPWPMISKSVQEATRIDTIRTRIARDRDPNAVQLATAKTDKKKKVTSNVGSNAFFHTLPFGMIMKKPFRGFGGGSGILGIKGFRYQYLFLGFLLGFFSKRRKQFLIAASISGVTLLYLIFPPTCTLLFRIMEAKWMLQRLETAGLSMMFPSLVFGAIAFQISQKLHISQTDHWLKRSRTVVVQGLIAIFFMLFAFSYSGQWAKWNSIFKDGDPFRQKKKNWSLSYRFAQLPAKKRQTQVRSMKRLRKFYQETIPKGSYVIVTDNKGMELVTLHDAHILDPIRSSVGVADLSYYRRLNRRVLNPITPWRVRRKILEQFDCAYYIPQRGRPAWLEGHIKHQWRMRQGKGKVIELKLDKDESPGD